MKAIQYQTPTLGDSPPKKNEKPRPGKELEAGSLTLGRVPIQCDPSSPSVRGLLCSFLEGFATTRKPGSDLRTAHRLRSRTLTARSHV